MATRGSYVHISMGRILGGIPIILVLCNFLMKIDGFEQKDSQGFENSYNSYETIPIREIFNFHHLPKLYFGFKISIEIFIYTVVASLIFLPVTCE